MHHLEKEVIDPNVERGRRVQQAVEGWSQYVAPYNPPTDSSVPLPDAIVEIMTCLLDATTQESTLSHPAALPYVKRLEKNWPTIWMWIQLLYAHSTATLKKLRAISVPGRPPPTSAKQLLEKERHKHELLVRALLLFLGLESDQEASTHGLVRLVYSTQGVFEMVVTAWIEEAEDDSAVAGFPTSSVHHDSLLYTAPNFQKLLIAGCGGRSDKAADLILRRLSLNIHRTKWQKHDLRDIYRNLIQQMHFAQNAMRFRNSTVSDALRAHPGFVACFVDVMICLLSPPFSTPPTPLFGLAMVSVDLYLSAVASHIAIRQILESPFFDIISRIALVHYTPQEKAGLHIFNSSCCHILANMRQFAIYRPLLLKTGQHLPSIYQLTEKTTGNLAEGLLDLQLEAERLVETYKQYKRRPHPVFCCGNRQCILTTDETSLFRCRSCKIALYCSKECQQQDWRDNHKPLCNAMSQSDEALLPQSSPDLRWLAHLITRDMIKEPSYLPFQEDAAGRLTDILIMNYRSQERPEKTVTSLANPSKLTEAGLLPEVARDAWFRSLTPRRNAHSSGNNPETIAVLIILPSAGVKITALLTYPSLKPPDEHDVHVTWILLEYSQPKEVES
ncbi:hypothetical protein HWV62_41288 [Athelia sp. TMB]|nr:hypothetical protein HWV62_41288 [Athelia sp. TMB]